MNIQTRSIDRIITERLMLIPFTIQICGHLLNNDFSDLPNMGLKRGKGWPDDDVIDTLPRIRNNLSRVAAPTGFESWMIVKKDTLEIIGDAGFKGFNHEEGNADIGYGIIEAERKNGYAAEAAAALIQWAFAQKPVKEITARCASNNDSSIKLLQKLGFTQTGEDEDMINWSLRNKQMSPA